jgi:hypothetical protein
MNLKMKQYDKEHPLIAIHVPKTAGTSFRKVLEQWFGNRLHFHYYDEIMGAMPTKVRLKHRFTNRFREGICIYGHFAKTSLHGKDLPVFRETNPGN